MLLKLNDKLLIYKVYIQFLQDYSGKLSNNEFDYYIHEYRKESSINSKN